MRFLTALLLLLLVAPLASAQQIWGGSPVVTPLFVTSGAFGNAADLTEDALLTYTVPAGVVVNVGDTLHIVAAGNFAATTDTKTARIRLATLAGASVALGPVATAASTVRWVIEGWVTKTDNTTGFFFASLPVGQNTNNQGLNNGATTLPDTRINTIPIIVSGQNSTSSAASSVTCTYLRVEVIRAPTS